MQDRSSATRLAHLDEIELVAQARTRPYGIYAEPGSQRLTVECREMLGRVYVHAWKTLKRKLHTDGLAHKLREMKLPRMRYSADQWDLIHRSEDVRDDLALAMIETASLRFLRNVVEKHRWKARMEDNDTNVDGSLGSGLLTYFVNACVYTYPEVFKAWARQRRAIESEACETWGHLPADPTLAVSSWDAVRWMVAQAKPNTRPILVMLALGHTTADIAEHLGITRRAVINRTYRFRCAYVKRHVDRGRLTPPPGHTSLTATGASR